MFSRSEKRHMRQSVRSVSEQGDEGRSQSSSVSSIEPVHVTKIPAVTAASLPSSSGILSPLCDISESFDETISWDSSDDTQSPLSSDVEDVETLSLGSELQQWYLRSPIPRDAFTALLKILINHGHTDLPKDCRTLLKTPVECPSILKCGGDYIYYGIKSNIDHILDDNVVSGDVELIVNIDGLPLFRSSKINLWPILGQLFGRDEVFTIANFSGTAKPDSVEDYLDDFVKEAVFLTESGICHGGQNYKFKIKAFVCDAPARAFIKNIVYHTGYFSCERCCMKGHYEDNRVVYSNTNNLQLRSGDLFNQLHYHPDHQRGCTPLMQLGADLVKISILDYMHLVCLGVMRKLLYCLVGKKKMLKGKLSGSLIKEISNRLLNLNGKLPSEFARQPRSLADLEYWKATELRTFLLYTGLVVLKGMMSSAQYDHFLTLSVAMTILLDEDVEFRSHYLQYARDLLCYFVANAANFYGSSFCTYNVHGLLHVADDVENFKCSLNNISAFPFENNLSVMKRYVHNGHNVLAQTFKARARLAYKEENKLKSSTFKVTQKTRNNCFLTKNNDVAFVQNVSGDGYLCEVVKFKHVSALFCSPIHSTALKIGHLRKTDISNHSKMVKLQTSDFIRKFISIPDEIGFILMPMRHKI